MASHSLHVMVLGGAAQASSTQSRYDQWYAGIPYIQSNPITGHGFGMGGSILETIQSIAICFRSSLRRGCLGSYFSWIARASGLVWPKNYLSDMSESGALAGALACSFIGFIMNRLVLSQKENHMLIFSLLAIVIVLNHEYARKRVPRLLRGKLQFENTARRTAPDNGAVRARLVA